MVASQEKTARICFVPHTEIDGYSVKLLSNPIQMSQLFYATYQTDDPDEVREYFDISPDGRSHIKTSIYKSIKKIFEVYVTSKKCAKYRDRIADILANTNDNEESKLISYLSPPTSGNDWKSTFGFTELDFHTLLDNAVKYQKGKSKGDFMIYVTIEKELLNPFVRAIQKQSRYNGGKSVASSVPGEIDSVFGEREERQIE